MSKSIGADSGTAASSGVNMSGDDSDQYAIARNETGSYLEI